MKSSLLITFEGGEGAGKSTLIESVQNELIQRGREVILTREPGGTPLSETVRDLLLGHHGIVPKTELLLYLAARAQNYQETIKPALDAGKIVLCDRFHDSTEAYQAGARGIDPEFVRTLCEFSVDGTNPNLTLYLDISPEEGLQRASDTSPKRDRIESEGLSFHEQVRATYRAIAEREPERFHLLDATQSPKDVFKSALTLIDSLLSK